MVKRDTARIAAAIAVAYVAFFVGGIFIHYFAGGDAYTLNTVSRWPVRGSLPSWRSQ